MDNLVKYIKTVKKNNYHIYGLLILIFIYDSYLECTGRIDGYICTITLSMFILSMTIITIVSKVKKIKYSPNGMLFVSSVISMSLSILIVSVTSILSFAFVYYPSLLFIFISLLIFYILLSHVVWNFLFFKNLFYWAIYLRIIILVVDVALLIIYLVCYYFYIAKKGTIRPSSLTDFFCLFCVLFFIWIFFGFFMQLWENVRYSFLRGKMEGKKYILFLRCFKFDRVDLYEDVLTNLSSIFKKEYNVLQIGNPKNILKGYSMCDTFYLPSIDWQSAVRNYIINADIVFLVLDQTNGVLWEMLHHTEQREKYIYYIPVNSNINELISNELFFNEHNNGNPIAMQFVMWQKELTEDSFFYFCDGTLHLASNIFSLIIEYMQQYELNNKEIIISKCMKFIKEPPYHIKQVDVFSLIVNGEFLSAYNHIEKRFLIKGSEPPQT